MLHHCDELGVKILMLVKSEDSYQQVGTKSIHLNMWPRTIEQLLQQLQCYMFWINKQTQRAEHLLSFQLCAIND